MSRGEAATLALCLLFFAQCRQCEHLEKTQAAAERTAKAAERIADALERAAAR